VTRAIGILLLPACGLLPNERGVPAPPAEGFGPFRDRGPVEICEGSVRLVPPEEGRADGAGLCVPGDAGPATGCGADAECGPRETCVCGRCTVPRCRTGTDCPAGASCDLATGLCAVTCFADSDCPGGVCEPDGCRTRCGSDADCARGETCRASTGLCLAQRCDAGLACAAGRTCDRVERLADLREPEATVREGRVELLLEERSGAGSAILRAVSDDGIRFRLDPTDPVLRDAGAPAIATADDVHVLYFERADGGIGRATGDGASFEADAEPVVAAPARSPGAASLGGGVVLAVSDGAGAVLLLRSADGRAFEPASATVDAGLFEDEQTFRLAADLGSPELVAERSPLGEERVVLYADALGVETSDLVLGEEPRAAPRTRSVVAAAATPDLAFEPYPFGPVFARVVNVTDYRREGAPSVVRRGSEVWLYYVGDETEGPSVAVQEASGP
jgi:hypothetical protein